MHVSLARQVRNVLEDVLERGEDTDLYRNVRLTKQEIRLTIEALTFWDDDRRVRSGEEWNGKVHD